MPQGRRLLVRAGAVLLVLAGISAALILAGPPRAGRPSVKETTPAAPSRTLFAFRVAKVVAVPVTSRDARAVSDRVAAQVEGVLSSFYDAAFFDPNGWVEGVPERAWTLFAGAAGARARKDASSLTLGEAGQNLLNLEPESSYLSVRVLVDPQGVPKAAIATVELDAIGARADGGTLRVLNRVRFLLQPSSGRWLISGYPTARTALDSAPPSATAGPTAATPTATGGSP